MTTEDTLTHCSLIRRIAAMFYDAILLYGVLFVATALVLPLSHGRAIPGGNIPYTLYLLACSYVYFSWQWTHYGQTPGMRAWRIHLIDARGRVPAWGAATLRFLLSLPSLFCFGLGFLWSLFDPQRLAFHDRYSRTWLVYTGRTAPA
jgi:uncharacterized RDD family membrane protein YckC